MPKANPQDATDASGLVAHFFRRESARLVASMSRKYGVAHIETIEDAVQTALARALSTWRTQGTPDNPAAWLTRTAHNQWIDARRRARDHDDFDTVTSESASTSDAPAQFSAEIDDDELRMLFVCCDDALKPRAQLVLALKLLSGFGTREIAARLFITDANVQKILSRAKHQLRETWAPGSRTHAAQEDWRTPPALQLPERLPSVLRFIYMLFNEGYSSQREHELIRRELCAEALRLGEHLVDHPVGNQPASWALLALMHFHAARFNARLSDDGELLTLREQDRSLWDRDQIQVGLRCLLRSAGPQSADASSPNAGTPFTQYHCEAAVLAEHVRAPRYEDTAWTEIVELYDMFLATQNAPLHALNRAIAVGEWKGPEEGLRLIEDMKPPAWLHGYYLYAAAIGHFARRAGQKEKAVHHLRQALSQAPTEAERRHLERELAACD